MTDSGADWWVSEGSATAWFEASSLRAGAELAGRITTLAPQAAIDVRGTGLRVRVDGAEQADAVSAAARALGLAANPAGLQQLSVVIASTDPSTVSQFWLRALDYTQTAADELVDPLRRDPSLSLRPTSERLPLRNRIHLDVVRPAAAVEQANLGEAFGPYGVCHADTDGNEVDLVPGDPLGEADGTADWQAVFSAIACYRVTSSAQQRELAGAAAALADQLSFPLLIDLRPGLVILDSGKDRWEADAHGLDIDFVDLAGRLQQTARSLGARADATLPRFVQLFIDAADVVAVRAFWAAALGYSQDRRAGVSDLHDPRWLNPVLVFQELDASDVERRRQPNRVHVELAVPSGVASARVADAVAAGGRLLSEASDKWHVADPEGNELVIVESVG